jgi:hypothetical protein
LSSLTVTWTWTGPQRVWITGPVTVREPDPVVGWGAWVADPEELPEPEELLPEPEAALVVEGGAEATVPLSAARGRPARCGSRTAAPAR